MRAVARAKVNLALHVVGRRDDGYHELDTLVTFAELGDVVVARPNPSGPPVGMAVEGPFADALVASCPSAGDNLVVRAAAGLRTLAERACHDCVPVHITLRKELPVAAGLGGGSADAAAAIAALSRLWSLPRNLAGREHLVRLIGADGAMCLSGRPLRARGIGDALALIAMPSWPIVLVNPGAALATPEVFARAEVARSGPLPSGGDVKAVLKAGGNDLEPAAKALAPEVGDVLKALATQPGAWLARMSGSGATCFALFENTDAAEAAARAITAARPAWWTRATRTVAS